MTTEELVKQIYEILMKTDWSKLSKFTPADAAKEIASLIEKNHDYYPQKFVLWLIFKCNVVDHLFEYWKNNIKDRP